MDNLLSAVVSDSTSLLFLAGLGALLGLLILLLILLRLRKGKSRAAQEARQARVARPPTTPATTPAATAATKQEHTRRPASRPAPDAAPASPTPIEQSTPSEPPLDEYYANLFSEDSDDSFEVSETNPLAEAEIFLQYGYLDKAAELLCWYAERGGSRDIKVHRMLMEIYQHLGRIDDYAESLERLIDLAGATAQMRRALLNGLKIDPENLTLRVLAKERFDLGLEETNALIGYQTTEESRPPDPHTTPVSIATPAQQAAAPASQTTLVLGDQPIEPLTVEEAEVLHAFAEPDQKARLQLPHDTVTGTIRALRRGIAKNPQSLVHYTELLKIHLQHRDIDAYARTLWQLCLVLGSAGQALKERLLGAEFGQGYHPVLEALAQAETTAQIEAIGRDHGLFPPETVQRAAHRKRPLVEAVAGDEAIAMGLNESGHDVLREVDSYLEYGQIESALRHLEEAILADHTAVQLYPPLLDLYDRMDDLNRFSAFASKLKQKTLHPREEVVTMMSDLYQRLKSRTEKIAA